MGIGLKTALAAGIKSKVALAVLAIVLATGGAAGAATAADHGAFGQQVKSQVATCKAQLAKGVHGIGDCVSDFATQHNPSNSDNHGKSGGDHGNSGSHGGPPSGTPGSSNGQGHGKP